MVAHERKIARVVTTKNVGEHIIQSGRLRLTKTDDAARNAQSKGCSKDQYKHTCPLTHIPQQVPAHHITPEYFRLKTQDGLPGASVSAKI